MSTHTVFFLCLFGDVCGRIMMKRRKTTVSTPDQAAALRHALESASLTDAFEAVGHPIPPSPTRRRRLRVLLGGRVDRR